MPRRVQKYQDEGNIWEDEPEFRTKRRPADRQADDERPRAPLMLRVLAWAGVVLLCFVGGYIGTSWGIKWAGTQGLFNQSSVLTSSADVPGYVERETAEREETSDLKKITLRLSYPKDGALVSEPFELISGIREQEIKDTIGRLFSVSGMFSKEVSVKHVFRNASTLYVDVGGPFIPMLADAGRDQSSLFITGIVHTMRDNFPPISDIRFFVNGAVTTAGSPVDLTAVWRLPE